MPQNNNNFESPLRNQSNTPLIAPHLKFIINPHSYPVDG